MRKLSIHSLPSKKETWIDRCDIMFHACFQLLQDCVEEEKLDTHCNYEAHKDFVDEIRFLYNWWLKRKQTVFNNQTEDSEMLNRLMKIRLSLWT